MKSNQPHDSWSRLVTAARAVPDDRSAAAPYGFSTRIAALAVAVERVHASLFDRFALRAVSLACALAIGSVLLNFSAVMTDGTRDVADGVNYDPVAVLLAE